VALAGCLTNSHPKQAKLYEYLLLKEKVASLCPASGSFFFYSLCGFLTDNVSGRILFAEQVQS